MNMFLKSAIVLLSIIFSIISAACKSHLATSSQHYQDIQYLCSIYIAAGSVDYEVTVVTTPSSGPFLTNMVVEFLCLIDPTPPEPVTYSWEFQRNAQFSSSDLFAGQRLSHIQLFLSFRFIWYFCKIYSNDTLVAVGNKLVEYYGKLLLCCVVCAAVHAWLR